MNSNKKGVQQNETISFKSMCEKYIFYVLIVHTEYILHKLKMFTFQPFIYADNSEILSAT